MSGMARPARKRKRPSTPASRLRRAADISLLILAVAAIGLFVAVKIIGGRDDPAASPNGKNVAGTADASSIGPEGASSPSGVFADLEAGPEEFEGDGDEDPLAGPAIVSDPYAARPFSPMMSAISDGGLRNDSMPSAPVISVQNC
ncbi:MAG: hypothetical protein HGA94_02525 [Candidatus Aminicenantes bacterium]|nr:hypothetical protein [Candidatus Aminicenantes bacterium]